MESLIIYVWLLTFDCFNWKDQVIGVGLLKGEMNFFDKFYNPSLVHIKKYVLVKCALEFQLHVLIDG